MGHPRKDRASAQKYGARARRRNYFFVRRKCYYRGVNMPARPLVPEIVPPEREGPVLAPGPISPGDLRTLYTVLDIQKTLGAMEHAVKALESAAKSQREKLDEVDKMQHALSILERSNVFHGQRLGELEKDLYAGKIIGSILVIGGGLTALAVFLFHRLAPLFSK